MRWISVFKSQGLKIEEPILCQDKKGNVRLGKLIEQRKTKDGLVNTFELAQFVDQNTDAVPEMSTEIEFVCFIEPKGIV